MADRSALLASCILLASLLLGCPQTPNQRAMADAIRLLDDGRVEEALAAFREAQRHSPDHPDFVYGEGRALYRQKRNAEAEAVFRRAIELDAEVSDYYLYLGHVLARLDRLEKALDAYHEVTQLAPIDAEGWKGVGLTEYNLGNGPEARAALEKYIAFAPTAPDHNSISRLVRSLPKQ